MPTGLRTQLLLHPPHLNPLPALQVTVLPADATQRSAASPQRQQTPEFNITITQLTNGQQFKFFVKVGATCMHMSACTACIAQ